MTLVAKFPVIEIEDLAPCPLCRNQPKARSLGRTVQIACDSRAHGARRHVTLVVHGATVTEAAEKWEAGPITLWRPAR